jgi:DNA-binding SARP family transcriptional activator/tetratricopeptide (TPR) repeat protein
VPEIGLLGELQMSLDGQAIRVGPPRQGTVLASLAVDAGRLVPLDTMIARVWGDHPPQAPRTGLYSYVARLRRAMVAGHDGFCAPLLRRPGGYLLDVEAECVDLLRVQRLTCLAQDAATDDGRRAQLLRDALGLWRGPALCGLPGDWAGRTRDQLEQQHVDLVVQWAHLQFRLGHPHPTLAVLMPMVAEHPLTESLVAALIRTLWAAGQRAEALDCYARTRRRLVDELGIEPGDELRAVHHAVLRDEVSPAEMTYPLPPGRVMPGRVMPGRVMPGRASLAARSQLAPRGTGPPGVHIVAGRDPSVTVCPAQLPPDLFGFAGRGHEIEALDAQVRARVRQSTAMVIVAICGPPGVGKTALATHWGHRVARHFADGQLYLNLRGFDPIGPAVEPADAVRRFLESLGVPGDRVPSDMDGRVALYRSLISDRRLLVVLDNARNADHVRPLLPGTPACVTVITSRHQLDGLIALDGARALPVGMLSPDEAHSLLALRLSDDRVASEPAAAAGIIEACAGLPLALAIVAARAAQHPTFPLAALVAELYAAPSRLTGFAYGDGSTDLRTLFSWSYDALTGGARRLFRLLALHRGPDITAGAAASLAGSAAEDVHHLLSELTGASLVAEPAPGRFAVHDLLRAYAAEQVQTVESAPQRRASVHRLLDHYLRAAHAGALLIDHTVTPVDLPPAVDGVAEHRHDGQFGALIWFAAEQANLLAIIDLAAGESFHQYTWQLAWSVGGFLQRQGGWQDQARIHRQALEAARQLGDRLALAHAHRGLARAYNKLNRHHDAADHLRQALALFEQLGDLSGQARTHQNLAWMFDHTDDPHNALRHSWSALRLYRAAGDRSGLGRTLNAVGWYHARLGDCARAVRYCRLALAVLREAQDQIGLADTSDSLGFAHHQLGQVPEAIIEYRYALALRRADHDAYAIATTLSHLGAALHSVGQDDEALESWHEALAILQRLAHPDADAVRTSLAEVHRTT